MSGSRSTVSARGPAVVEHVAELALHLAGLPGVGVVDAGQQVDAVGQRGQPVPQRPRTGERVDDALQPVDVLGELAGQLDAIAADVVERQRGVDPGVRVVGHRDAGQHPVDAETPGVVDEVDAVRLAMVLVEAPADVGLRAPSG